MRLKIGVFVMLVTLMVSSVSMAGLTTVTLGRNSSVYQVQYTYTFLSPQVEKKGDYAVVTVEGANQMVLSPGMPQLPTYTTIITFPFGAHIQGIDTDIPQVYTEEMQQKIMPGGEPVPVKMEYHPMEREEGDLYSSDASYPGEWCYYRTGVGIVEGNRACILSLQVYPVQYRPLFDQLAFIQEIQITVTYTLPSHPLETSGEYDLLVLCPDGWKDALQAFAEHKGTYGIKTLLVSLDEVTTGTYFTPQGRDEAEQVKYFIKNAVDEWGINNVLLVGGRKPGIREEWLMPVRYVHVYWADEGRYASDLYFADLYDASYNFSTWDTDENNVFCEWPRNQRLKDDVDLYPDVYIGRWACRSKLDLDIMIKKTIIYEKGSTSKRVVLAGGDNFPEDGIEGEIVCDKTLEFLPGYEADKIYVSQMDVTSKAMKEGLDKGSTFIHLHGHGSPIYWSTHKVNDTGDDAKWEDGLKFYDVPFFFNKEYPIALVGGCHTAMFNVSLTVHPWTGGIPAIGDISWSLARKYNGGGIAALGYTCFPVATPGESGDLDGDGITENDDEESGYGYMQLMTVYAHGMEGYQYLGECWGYAVNQYIDHFAQPAEQWHLHTIQGFVLLGDPTLKIGGYGER